MVPRRNREPTMVHTWLSCSARAGIAVNNSDPLRDYTDVLSFVDILSKWSWHFVSICHGITSKSIFSILSDDISWICIYLQLGGYMLLHPWRSSFESRDEILLRGKAVTPQVSISCYVGRFILISDAQWKFLFLDHIYLHSSSYSWMFHYVWNYSISKTAKFGAW
jgi:hypothetical protein